MRTTIYICRSSGYGAKSGVRVIRNCEVEITGLGHAKVWRPGQPQSTMLLLQGEWFISLEEARTARRRILGQRIANLEKGLQRLREELDSPPEPKDWVLP